MSGAGGGHPEQDTSLMQGLNEGVVVWLIVGPTTLLAKDTRPRMVSVWKNSSAVDTFSSRMR